MKILIDIQSLQTSSAFRGIGRYTTSLISSLLINHPENKYYLLINDKTKNENKIYVDNLLNLISTATIIEIPIPENFNYAFSISSNFNKIYELKREEIINKLQIDALIITSLFEFESISTIPQQADRNYICATILYDLIPLSDPENYLINSKVKNWYNDKIKNLTNSDLIFAISDFTRNDAIEKLKIDPDKIINISGAVNLHKLINPIDIKNEILFKDLANKKFIFYAGGFDKRKRVSEIINAFSNIDENISNKYQLVFVGKISKPDKDLITNTAISKKINENN